MIGKYDWRDNFIKKFERIDRAIRLLDSVRDAPLDLLRIDGIQELIAYELEGVCIADVTERMRTMGIGESTISNYLMLMGYSSRSVKE